MIEAKKRGGEGGRKVGASANMQKLSWLISDYTI